MPEADVSYKAVSGSEVEQHAQPGIDLAQRLGRDRTPSRYEPLPRDRPDVLRLRVAPGPQAALRRLELDVERNALVHGRDRQHDDEAGRAVVEPVGRHDERRPAPRLLAAPRGTEL